jgi:hypothetical protein
VKRTTETTERTVLWSPGCALPDGPSAMPGVRLSGAHVRPQYRSTSFTSRGSPVV